MKHTFLAASAAILFVSGCAANPPLADGVPPGAEQNASNQPVDPTYPGRGVNIGIGLGRWGGVSGGGVGVGYGW